MKNVFRTFAAIIISAGIAQANSWCTENGLDGNASMFVLSTKGVNTWISGKPVTTLPTTISSINGMLIVAVSNGSQVKSLDNKTYTTSPTNIAYFYLPLTFPWSDALAALAIKASAENRSLIIVGCETMLGKWNTAPTNGSFMIDRMMIGP